MGARMGEPATAAVRGVGMRVGRAQWVLGVARCPRQHEGQRTQEKWVAAPSLSYPVAAWRQCRLQEHSLQWFLMT